jgi:hypothetical protein
MTIVSWQWRLQLAHGTKYAGEILFADEGRYNPKQAEEHWQFWQRRQFGA